MTCTRSFCLFQQKHGHCNVCYRDKSTQLAMWVGKQRYIFSTSKMDQTRKQRLDNIGFVWEQAGNKRHVEEENEDSNE